MNLLTTLRQGAGAIAGGVRTAAARVIDREEALARMRCENELLRDALSRQLELNGQKLSRLAAAERADPG